VHQKEQLFGYLTPREHLTFHAFARMSRKCSRQALLVRVEEVLREVKLEKCADTIIGGSDPSFARKGISGGERKRLDLAAELLLAPDIIFLDEPSSGAWRARSLIGSIDPRLTLTHALLPPGRYGQASTPS